MGKSTIFAIYIACSAFVLGGCAQTSGGNDVAVGPPSHPSRLHMPVFLDDASEIVALLKADDAGMRIIRVVVNSESVEVVTGWMEAPLVGEGWTYTLVRRGGKWVIDRKERWVS